MRRALLPLALAPLAIGAVPPGLTGAALAQGLGLFRIPPREAIPVSPRLGTEAVQPAPTVRTVAPALPTAPQVRPRADAAPQVPTPPVLDRPVLGGPELTAEVAQSFELDTNLDLDDDSPGTSYFAETRLSFGLLEETPVQSFSLGFDTGLRALWPADDDFEWTVASPSTASADYEREWSSGDFATGFSFRQSRVDFSRSLLDFFDPDLGEVVVPDDPAELEGDAVERRYDGRFALGLATDAPSSYRFGLTANRIDYDETAGDLTPRTTIQGSATWTLALTPAFSGALSARGFYYNADSEEETEIREGELDAGLIYDPSEVLRLSAGVGIVQRVREERPGGIGPVETVEDDIGASARIGANYAFEDFTIDAGLRATTAPDLRLSGNLYVIYPLDNGQVNARIFRTFAGGTGGEEISVLGAGIGLERDLGERTSISFDLAASHRTNEDDPADPDVTRFDFTTAVQYELTERITADVGYRYRRLDEEPTEADSHSVFVQVGRSFVSGF